MPAWPRGGPRRAGPGGAGWGLLTAPGSSCLGDKAWPETPCRPSGRSRSLPAESCHAGTGQGCSSSRPFLGLDLRAPTLCHTHTHILEGLSGKPGGARSPRCWPRHRGHRPHVFCPTPSTGSAHRLRGTPGPASGALGEGSPPPASPPHPGTPPAPLPRPPVCPQTYPVISGEHTQEVRPGRAHPNPDLRGMEHKSRPFSPGGSLPAGTLPAGWLRWRLRRAGRAGWVGGRRAPGPGQRRPHLARGGSSGGHGQARVQAAGMARAAWRAGGGQVGSSTLRASPPKGTGLCPLSGCHAPGPSACWWAAQLGSSTGASAGPPPI